jgi:S-DNA-T family DNA segregation ATPase FtsK/SpoIIIE
MLGTLALTALLLGIGGIDVYKNGEQKDLRKQWEQTMKNAGIHDKSTFKNTFKPLKMIKKEYGYDMVVYIPDGMSYDDLEKSVPIIEKAFKCKFYPEWNRESGCVFARLIQKPLDDKREFTPIKTKPYELYLGTTHYHKEILSDMTKFPHILITGSPGTGKTMLLFIILTNLIANFGHKEINIYLAQVSDKHDSRVFKDCEQVKCYAKTPEEACKMLAHIYNVMAKRNKVIDKHMDINNIQEYNKKFRNEKWEYIYVSADEFSYYVPDEIDNEVETAMKEKCLGYLKSIAKQGRSAGVFLLTGLQRPDKENMPPIFKAQLNTKVGYRQPNKASALTALDDAFATELEEREALAVVGATRYIVKPPFISMELIQRHIQPSLCEENHYIDLSSYNYVLKDAQNSAGGSKKGGKKSKSNNNKPIETAKANSTPNTQTSKGSKGVVD